MPKSRKNNERGKQVRISERKPARIEPLRPKAQRIDKLYNDLAKFPSENPYPILRIHKDGTVLYANKASEPLLKAKGSGVGQPAPDEWRRLAEEVLKSGRVAREEVKDDGRVFALRAVPIVSNDYVNLYGTDITEQKMAEEERELTIKLLSLINSSNRMQELMKLVTVLLRDWSGCEAVGIRLQEGEDFPYFVTSGFSEEFVLAETKLCSVNEMGELERDSQGRPYLECMCGNIISGRFDPTKPFFTEHGSFWTNSTTDLLASTNEADRLVKTRNRCNTAGYESVALVPLRVVKEIFGLLQLNSKQKGRFTPEKISLLERLADNLAIGLAQRRSEQSLRESEGLLRGLFENMTSGAAIYKVINDGSKGSDYIIRDFNAASLRIEGKRKDEVIGKSLFDLRPNIDQYGLIPIFQKVWQTGEPGYFPSTIYVDEKYSNWYENWVFKLPAGEIVAIYDDVTERKKAEEKVKAERQRLYDVLETLPVMVCLLTPDYHVAFTNRLFRQKFGEDNGRHCYDYIFGRKGPCEFCETYNVLKTGKPHHWECTGPDGCSIIDVYDFPFTDTDGSPLILEMDIDITEQKRAGEALRESEERLKMALDAAELGIWDWDMVSGHIKWEGHHAQLFGFKEGEFDGRFETFEKRVHQEDIAGLKAAVEQSIKERSEYSCEYRVVWPDGTLRWISGKGRCHYDQTGRAVRMLGVINDITERKNMEAELRKERDFDKSLVETAQAIVLVLDTRGRIASFNPYMEEISGYKLEEVLGLDWFSAFLPKRDRERVRELFKKAATDIQTRGNVNPIVTKNGQEREIEWYDKTLKDKDGNIIGVLATGQDITERKRTQEQLQQERNLLRTLIDHIPDAIYVKDKDSRFIDCNKTMVEYWDAKGAGNIIGKTDFDLFEHTKAQQFLDEEQTVLRTGQVLVNREGQSTDKAGNTNYFLVTKVPLRDSRGNIIGTVGINHDITERRKAEEELRRLNRVMETITEINQFIFRIQDRDELLRKVCEAIVKYAYRMVWIGFCDEKTKQIVPQAQAGFEERYLDSVKITYNDSEYGMGPSGMAVKTAKPNVMRFIATDPQYEPWRQEAIKRGYLSSAAIPIFSETKVVGVLNIYAGKEDAFNEEEVKLLEELSHDISTGLRGIDELSKRQKVEHTLLEHQKKLKRLASQLTLAEERERRRIAGELHDHVSQSLALAKIKLDSLQAALTSQPLAGVIEDISGSIEKAIQDTRSLTFDLSNPILYELGFEAAVSEWLNENVRDKHKINTEFQDDGQDKPLDDDMRALLFRNVRELLINTIKYANADKVRVSVRRIDDSIEVTVEDNGVGFDPVEARAMGAKRQEFGLFSIRESLEELGGRFEIESKPGAGCKITMTAPLKGQTLRKEE